MKIAHISDIHWRGLTRHQEYTKAFNALFERLWEVQPDIIFLGGDYFHTKTSGISPEVIGRLAWMFKSFADIAHTYAILGNHDGNLANESREDAISPIIEAIDNPRIHLLKKSGVYSLPVELDAKGKVIEPAVNFCVFSCFDKEGWANVVPTPGLLNIAAFHGSVGGTRMDNGWIMPDSKAEVMLSMFDEYDFVFLGDIHKRQYLAERADKNGTLKPWVGYPGSTIQQNFGEEQVKGFLVWDIRSKDDWDVSFEEVANFQPFITFPWILDVEHSIKALEGHRELLPGSRYRVTSRMPLNPLYERQMAHELKVVRGAEEVLFKSEKGFDYDSISDGEFSVKKASLRNDKAVMHKFYREFLDLNSKKFQIEESLIDEGCKVIDAFLDRFNSSEIETARDVYWSIKQFEFDNLFRYGPGNKIDFDNLDGVVGVFGKNKLGKSSLVGALMYALFNGSDRDGITKNGQIMNQNKKSCSAKIVVTVNGTDYRIERSSQRVALPKKGKKAKEDLEEFDGDKTETKVVFTQLNPDGTETSLNGTTREETDKAIRKLLGNSQDFLMTSVATQSKMERFIEEGPSSRKAILNRFLDLDIFEKLYNFSKEELAVLSVKASSYSTDWFKQSQELLSAIAEKENELKVADENITKLRDELDQVRSWIAKNESSDSIEAAANLLKTQQKLFSLNRQLANAEQERTVLAHKIANIQKEIDLLEEESNQIDFVGFQADLQRMKEIEENLTDYSLDVREQERSIAAKEKNIRKLTLVPCGDQFPSCLYIKDSHEDKKTIEANKAKLVESSKQLAAISAELKKYQELQLKQKMARHLEIRQTLKELTKEKAEKETQLGLVVKSHADISKWLKGAQQEETKLLEIAASKDDAEMFDLKKKEQTKLQNALFAQERTKSDALVQIGKNKAKLEQLSKDQEDASVLLNKSKVLETVQAAFHKNGIPAIILKTQLPAINAELANLLGGLVDFNITFETEPGSNSMDVYIEDGHSRRILELGSGMEKMIASIAIRVALCNLSSLPKSNLIILDEGFNALDEEHVGKCLELLQTLKSGFKTIMVISHMQRVKEAADSIIEVVSTGQDSRVEA
jgi:DNA repair exonuclease SbcCD ATPase subunit/DNA repair exonuclease SbcCD nuclease subunit